MSSHGPPLIQGKRLSFGHPNVNNASILIEKQKAALRRSTPDSEALASSDDEEGQQRGFSGVLSKPTRRPSWINDSSHTLQRQPSLGSSEPKSPGGLLNHPVTPDGNGWPPGSLITGRSQSGSTSLPWNSGIWNNEPQKAIHPRLAEVLSSPTAHGPAGAYSEEALQSPRRESSSDTSIPFAIPLQPTLKSYRSQSYSVGQLDQEFSGNGHFRSAQPTTMNARTRAGSSYSGLQHRPSRPSVLGEFGSDGSTLGQLREVEDDEESTTSSDVNSRFSNSQARRIEQLAMENAILRQRAQLGQLSGMVTSNSPYGSVQAVARAPNRGVQMSESVLEEPDDEALGMEDELSQNQAFLRRQGLERRASEYAANMTGAHLGHGSDQKYLLGGKKGQWQSSLGFGGSFESQSRRHSFAEVPLRHSSVMGLDANGMRAIDTNPNYPYNEINHNQQMDDGPALLGSQGRLPEGYRSSPGVAASQSSYASNIPIKTSQFGSHHTPQAHSLYLVTFKAARAEFYYVQEGTGLELNPGDLVIVEADRGTDLGTVAHKNVDWAAARDLKDQYVTEHYNWLMMFSRQGQNGQGAPKNGWPSTSYADRAHHGLGSSQGMPSATDNISSEIKPKMIKRLAQPHEIHSLREKEGNEAKAKRMCQQKVAEHHLNMEILDAEFQMDWKKLTFYYFAESYINFNSLVTDLFKIYKTRIWMSAINPASFVSPTGGPQVALIPGNQPAKSARHRISDPRSKHESHMLTAQTNTELPLEASWQGQSDRSTGLNPNVYNQFWPGQAYQQMPPTYQDFPNHNMPTLRNLHTMPSSGYFSPTGPRPDGKSDYKGEEIPTSYGDSLNMLQGLTLGHS